MDFAYLGSLLPSTITVFGGTRRHPHTSPHAISWYFSLDFFHKAKWFWNRGLGHCAQFTYKLPIFTFGLFHLPVGISAQWELGAVSRVFSLSLSWRSFLPHTDIKLVLTLKSTQNSSMPFLHNNPSNIYPESSRCP